MVMFPLLLRQDAEVCKFVVDSQAQWCHLRQRFPVRLQDRQNAMDKTTIKLVTLSTTKAEYAPPLMPPMNLSGFSVLLVKYFGHSNTPLFFTQITNLPLHWLICKGNSMPAQNILTFGGT